MRCRSIGSRKRKRPGGGASQAWIHDVERPFRTFARRDRRRGRPPGPRYNNNTSLRTESALRVTMPRIAVVCQDANHMAHATLASARSTVYDPRPNGTHLRGQLALDRWDAARASPAHREGAERADS